MIYVDDYTAVHGHHDYQPRSVLKIWMSVENGGIFSCPRVPFSRSVTTGKPVLL
jgi:hypothetical protein